MSGSGVALMLTGGHSHPPELSMPSLGAVASDAGLTQAIATDPESALCTLEQTDPSLLVVNALRFTMAHERYDEFRDAWGFSLSDEARRNLERWVLEGRPLLALHTALVSFDDWDRWGDLIGGSWDWSRSHHPPVGPVEVRCDPTHAATRGLGDFTLDDEWYADLDLRDGNEVVATTAVGGAAEQPACWVREVDGTRVAVSTLGHDERSLDRPEHRALLTNLVGWLLDERRDAQEAATA